MIAGFLLRCRQEAHRLQLADDSMQLERLNASLLSHVADVDGTLKVSAQRQPHPVGLEAAVDYVTVKLVRDLELITKDHTTKHNDVQSSFATAHWHVQKFKDDVAPQFGGIKTPASCPPLPPGCSCLRRIRRPGEVMCERLVYFVARKLICFMLFLLCFGICVEFHLKLNFFTAENFVTQVVWHLCADGCGAGGAVFLFPPAPEFVHRVVADQGASPKCPEFSNR